MDCNLTFDTDTIMATRLTFVLLSLVFSFSQAQAQTIAEERQKLADHEQRIVELKAVNADIDANIKALEGEITNALNQIAPEADSRGAAEQRYQAAQAAVEGNPSPANQQAAETAKFEFFMADRKYQRASKDVKRLEAERADLQRAKASNTRQLQNTGNMVSHQRKLISQMEEQARLAASKQASSERQLRAATETQLEQTKADHAAAIAEIERLKAQLAQKEAAAAEQLARDSAAADAAQAKAEAEIAEASAAEAAATAAAAETVARLEQSGGSVDTSAFKSELAQSNTATQLASADIKQADPKLWTASTEGDAVGQYKALMALAEQDDSTRKLNKILHIKTYRNNDLTKQTSHTLKYLGNDQYKGRTRIRPGKTKFVVGRHSWDQKIERSENKAYYVFVLDYRDPKNPALLVLNETQL